MVRQGLQDADYEDRMKTSGFDGFAQAFLEMVDHRDVQTWAYDQFKDALAGLPVTPSVSDSLTAMIDALRRRSFPGCRRAPPAQAHRHGTYGGLVAVADDTYNKLERALALATRRTGRAHGLAHGLGDEWALFEADVNVCLARLATLAGTYPPTRRRL